jgi:DNA mismatch repair ATPase MutS
MPPLALLLLAFVVLTAVVLFLPRYLSQARSSVRIARTLRDERAARHTDVSLIGAYHAQLSTSSRADSIDDHTWKDLDLDDVYFSLDHTASEPGRQYLYHLLRSPSSDTETLARLDRVANTFADDEMIRQRARAALAQLRDSRAAYLHELFFGDIPSRPGAWWLFPLLTASAVACLLFVAIWPPLFVVWLGICVLNVGVQVLYKPTVRRFIPAIHEVPAFLRVAGALGELKIVHGDDETRILREGRKRLGALRLATRWLAFESGQASDLAGTVYEYFNLLFLLDVNAFVFATSILRDSRDVTRGMFDALGYLDAAQSIATWRKSLSRWSRPEFSSARKSLHVEDVAHPLLANAVPNSLDVDGQSVLITGSNMSGKTTFVRTLGVNAVLAQTLCTTCAGAWRAPLLSVRTSIGRADSLVDGKSYYLAEVESVLALVRAKDDARQHLFLLDEVFRGTNTTERVAAAYAVLAHLNKGDDLVVAATHDLELLELLRGTYAMHHFREQIVDDGLTFDYLIQSGPSSTRNAIALLRLMRYPESLVADALSAIDGLSGNLGRTE